jgi:hypothetical protein
MRTLMIYRERTKTPAAALSEVGNVIPQINVRAFRGRIGFYDSSLGSLNHV